MVHVPLRLKLDGDALVANWHWLAHRGGGAACGAAVKADGYGLGAREAVKRLAGGRLPRFLRRHLGRGRGADALAERPRASPCFTASGPTTCGGARLAGAARAEQPGAGRALARNRAKPALRRDGRYRHEPARPHTGAGAVRPARRARDRDADEPSRLRRRARQSNERAPAVGLPSARGRRFRRRATASPIRPASASAANIASA